MKKIYRIVLIIFLSLLIFSTTIFAIDKLNLQIKVSKEVIKVGDEFKVAVDWKERNAGSRL